MRRGYWQRVLVPLVAAGICACVAEVEYPQPVLTYAAEPVMVEIAPGVSVIEDSDYEIFYSGGYYWYRNGGHWWRTPDLHRRWVVAAEQVVPQRIRAYPVGQYSHYRRTTVEPPRETVQEHPVERVQ
jgi:hypothetical protein